MKKRILCPYLPKPGCSTPLTDDEAHHATRVLRLREGDVVEAMDGKGNSAFATLRIKGGSPRLEYLEREEISLRPKLPILPVILEMAVLKGDAMEWIVEKAVELGIFRLVPVLTDHTVVQMKSKGPLSFRDRWQKIADQALKQCGRPHRMEVELPIALEDLLVHSSDASMTKNSKRLWCDETSCGQSPYLLDWLKTHSSETQWNSRILIGPEGGWSMQERQLLNRESQISNSLRIDLGPQVLRAETAALFAISLVTSFALKSQESIL